MFAPEQTPEKDKLRSDESLDQRVAKKSTIHVVLAPLNGEAGLTEISLFIS
jgi:hypothetical protein